MVSLNAQTSRKPHTLSVCPVWRREHTVDDKAALPFFFSLPLNLLFHVFYSSLFLFHFVLSLALFCFLFLSFSVFSFLEAAFLAGFSRRRARDDFVFCFLFIYARAKRGQCGVQVNGAQISVGTL